MCFSASVGELRNLLVLFLRIKGNLVFMSSWVIEMIELARLEIKGDVASFLT